MSEVKILQRTGRWRMRVAGLGRVVNLNLWGAPERTLTYESGTVKTYKPHRLDIFMLRKNGVWKIQEKELILWGETKDGTKVKEYIFVDLAPRPEWLDEILASELARRESRQPK